MTETSLEMLRNLGTCAMWFTIGINTGFAMIQYKRSKDLEDFMTEHRKILAKLKAGLE